jgi:hypothetical protein
VLIQRNEKQTVAQKLTTSLEISGNILFTNIPIKNAVIELIVHGINGEVMLNVGKTLSGPTGHFYFKRDIPLPFRGQDIGIRVCVYSTPSAFGKPFPIFFGAETFLLLPSQRTYDLGNILLPLAWSFCERPLIFSGEITKKDHEEYILSGKTAQLQTPHGYVLAETPVSIDGTYQIYTYGDGRIPEYTKLMICILEKGKMCSSTKFFINPFTHVYKHDLEIQKT